MKGYIMDQFIFGRDIILPIKHMVYWKLILQKKLSQINKDNIRKNRNRVDHNYKVGSKVMLNNHAVYKYETPYKGPFVIIRCCTNVTVSLKIGTTEIRYNISHIKPYKYDNKVEDFT